MKLADLPKHSRPREKLRDRGAASLRTAELLAVIFRTGYQGKNAVQVAERVLRHTPLPKLLQLPFADLAKIKGIGASRAAALLAVGELSKLLCYHPAEPILKAEDVVRTISTLKHRRQEYLVALYLNARKEIITQETISIGTLDATVVHPREVFAPAIAHRASQVIVAHNHPSGDSTPSLDDIEATERLIEAGSILDIPLIDHVVVASDGWYSLREQQLVEFPEIIT